MKKPLPLLPAAPRPDTAELLPLTAYDLVLVNFSGGKDSLALVLHVLEQGVHPARIQLWHQRVDGAGPAFMDWPVTEAYCCAVAGRLGLRLLFQWKDAGFLGEMLRENAKTRPTFFESQAGAVCRAGGLRGRESTRRLFPQLSADLSVRWCSAYLKRDVAEIAINNDPDLNGKKILVLTGERREESSARARYARIESHRCNRAGRLMHHYRAVIDWTERQVWSIIERYGIAAHPCYHLGWGRCSCMACIFGDMHQWASLREIDPVRFRRLAAYEQEFGKTIRRGATIAEQAARGTPYVMAPEMVRLALGSTYPVSQLGGPWSLPAGAYTHCGGPS